MLKDKSQWIHVEGFLDQESKIGLANKVKELLDLNV